MLTFNQVALSIGAQTLIENINFSVYPKQVIGIIGDNGCGKSSLFAMIQAYLEPAQGRIEWQNNITIAALEQEVKALECSVLEHVLASDENFFEIYQRLMRAQQENDGINIAAKKGTPIKSVSDGNIVYVGNALKGYGNLVIIKHQNNWLSAYAHNDEVYVTKNQQIKQGDIIATVGSSGDAEKSQLYFSLRKGRQAVNPKEYLSNI